MSKYSIEFSKTFNKSFSKLDKKKKDQIQSAIDNFLSNPGMVDIIKLKGNKDFYRIRSGDYRIIFKEYEDRLLIVFVDVKHRREAYRDL